MPQNAKSKPVAKTKQPIQLAERRTQKQRKQEAETAIIRAAIGLIAEKGLPGLTLAAAGEAAGYSRGIASHHFGKKDDLLCAIVNHITRSFSRYLAQDTNIAPGLPMIRQVIQSYLNDVERSSVNIRALQLILTEAVSNPVLKPALDKVNKRSVQGLADHIQHGIKAGEIRADINVNNQAVILLATLRGVMGQWLIDPKAIDLSAVREQLLKNVDRILKI